MIKDFKYLLSSREGVVQSGLGAGRPGCWSTTPSLFHLPEAKVLPKSWSRLWLNYVGILRVIIVFFLMPLFLDVDVSPLGSLDWKSENLGPVLFQWLRPPVIWGGTLKAFSVQPWTASKLLGLSFSLKISVFHPMAHSSSNILSLCSSVR